MKNSITQKAGLVTLATGCLIMLSCVTNVLTGQTVKETRDVGSFTGVTLAFSGNVYITQGSPAKVVIEADQNTMDKIETEIHGSNLVLKTRDGYWRNLGKINAYITMPDVSNLSVTGSGDLICESPLKTNDVELFVSGSGSVRISSLSGREVTANITGSGDIVVAGNTGADGEMDATITGSGSIKAEGIPVSEATVHITGSGSAAVNVTKELETSITGSGSVNYKGNPLVNASATGSGRTRSIN
ncbi:MAG TPA: head GIN domain-containing protein [Bacteroidales bacterium]|nr:head GIN domain-containing protein [Bacteroidales bacterium]